MTSAIFLRGSRGDEYVIVAKSDVLDMWSEWDRSRFIRDCGEATLRALFQQPPRWLGFSIFDDPYADRDHLEFALDDALRLGRLVPVRIEPTWRRLDPGPSVMLRDLIKTKPDEPQPSEPPRPTRTEETFTYELRLVDEIGVPIAGVPLSLTVSGAPRRLVTDLDGGVRVDDASTSNALAQLPDLGALQDALRPRWEQIRNGDWLTDSEEHTYVDCADPLPMVKVRAGRLHTIVVHPRVMCARLLELLFDTNKTFLLPSALEHIHSVVGLYEKRPNSKLLIVGHTDVTGDPDVNDPLSLNRAKAIRAYLTDDVETWLEFYGNHMNPKARWGTAEDQLMLGAILAATGEPLTDTRVRHFQATRGLKVDGSIGEQTRRALIAEYMAADGTTLPENIEPLVHGCGESFPLDVQGGKADHAHDRRVELFFFDAALGVLPPPPGDISSFGDFEYLEWRLRATETHDFQIRLNNAVAHTPRPWGTYQPKSVLLLPEPTTPHPWSPVVALLAFLADHPDHGALIVGHRTADEPPDFGELRARALLDFLQDDCNAWTDVAAKHGRVRDVQGYLEYLHATRRWDTHVPSLTDKADAATARAVESFQKTYNLAFNAAILEDGVIGRETLGAVFDVAKAELIHWMEKNDVSLDSLGFFSEQRRVLDAGAAFGAEPRVELLAVPLGVPYDLARQPSGSGLYPLAKLFPIAVEDVVSPRFGVLEVQVIDERGEPLAARAYELRVAHDTRVGVTDDRGMLAEPFLPEGIPILRFDGGHPVLFHDLYQPRVSLPPTDELDDFSHIADNLEENDDDDDFTFGEEIDEELDEDKDHVMD